MMLDNSIIISNPKEKVNRIVQLIENLKSEIQELKHPIGIDYLTPKKRKELINKKLNLIDRKPNSI
jgi:type II secretory pathway component GspD/PulD (secretin)